MNRVRWICGLMVAALCLAVFAPMAEAARSDKPKLPLRQRRALGLTRWQLVQTARELDQAGELDRKNHKEAAKQLLRAATQENAKAWSKLMAQDEAPQWTGDDRDWEDFFKSLIVFLEKLMPFLLMLIEIFSKMAILPIAVGLDAVRRFFFRRAA